MTAKPEPGMGIGVDSMGGPVVDPTENVRELVLAESKYQTSKSDSLKELMLALIESLKDQIKMLSEASAAYQNAQVASETRRIDQLAQTRQEFQNTIRDMLAESVRTTSTLVSTQLVQIQATFDTRVSKLEAGAFTQAGKSSVSDPATADALTKMATAINALTSTKDVVVGHSKGIGDSWVVLLGALGGAAVLYELLSRLGH
jgi:DNA anti-recombination protein RmuC